MRDALIRVLNEYIPNSKQAFAGNTLADFLRHGAADDIRREAHITSRYLVEGSPGKGRWAEVPWICVFDKSITTSAEEGYYIVYLFDANMEGVYLSLNQGWVQYERKYRPREKAQQEIRAMAQHYQSLIKSSLQDFPVHSINLHAKNVLGAGYELGHICGKYYPKDNVPAVDELVEDLQNLRGVYRELKGILSGSPVTEKKSRSETGADEEQLEQEEEAAERQATKLSDEELLRRARLAETKPPTQVESKHYPRDPNVVAYAKRKAKGVCDLCKKEAPFISKDGEPFLECHHIVERAEGGLDNIENTVALCPNCHRKMHNLKLNEDKKVLQDKAKGK